MYAPTSMPLVRRTRATFRSAEFGFFGVVVYTRVQTPRRWGHPFSAGVLVFETLSWRPLRTSCWIVGTRSPVFVVLVWRMIFRRPPRSGVSNTRTFLCAGVETTGIARD